MPPAGAGTGLHLVRPQCTLPSPAMPGSQAQGRPALPSLPVQQPWQGMPHQRHVTEGWGHLTAFPFCRAAPSHVGAVGEQQVSIPNVPDLAWPLHDLQRCPCMSQHPWHPKEPHPGSAGSLCCLSTRGFSGITLCCTDSGGAWWLFSRTWGVFSFQQNHRFFEEGPVLYMQARPYLVPKRRRVTGAALPQGAHHLSYLSAHF